MTKQSGWAGGPRGLFSPRQHLHGGGAFPQPPTSGFAGAAVVMVTSLASHSSWGLLGRPPHYGCQRKGPRPLLHSGWGQRHTKKPGSQTSRSRGKPPAFSASQPGCPQLRSPCFLPTDPVRWGLSPCTTLIQASVPPWGKDTERNKMSPGSLSSCWHWGRVGDERKAKSM